MAEESQVKVKIVTTADDSGARQIDRALGIVVKSQSEVNAAREQFLTAAEREVAEINRLTEASKREAAAKAQAAQQMAASSKLNEEAMQRLAAASERTQKFFTPAAVNPWATASGNARARVDDLHVAQVKAAGSSRNMGNALLQASRGLQDMQYGLAGAVNNLEGIASALGLGAGVAGAVTVVAVAAQQLGPHVVTWLKSLDTAGAKLKDLISSLNRAGEAIKGDYSSNTDNAARVSEAFTEVLKQERDALEANSRAVDSNVKLLQQRANLQKTADQQKLDSDIKDIEAQGMPPEQEKAAIAARKRAALDADKARQDQLASEQLGASAEKLMAEAKQRDELKARQAALEDEKRNAIAYAALLAERAKLEEKAAVKKRELNAGGGARGERYDPRGEQELAKLQEQIEANKQQSRDAITAAPGGRIRSEKEISGELGGVKSQAQAAADQTAKDAAALEQQMAEERLARAGRDNTYQREAEKIAREAQGGVFNGDNVPLPQGALDFGPAPLPAPAAPGSILVPAPFQPAELAPPRIPSTAATTDTGVDKIAASNDAANTSFLKVADAMVSSNAAVMKRMEKLESQLRNQALMA